MTRARHLVALVVRTMQMPAQAAGGDEQPERHPPGGAAQCFEDTAVRRAEPPSARQIAAVKPSAACRAAV
ncbi:hypothetical protein SVIOM74S_00026 [Streptomyces violarus]